MKSSLKSTEKKQEKSVTIAIANRKRMPKGLSYQFLLYVFELLVVNFLYVCFLYKRQLNSGIMSFFDGSLKCMSV